MEKKTKILLGLGILFFIIKAVVNVIQQDTFIWDSLIVLWALVFIGFCVDLFLVLTE